VFIDPIDGTKNLMNGYLIGVCSLIGIVVDERPVLGVLHHPFAEGNPVYYGGLDLPLHMTPDGLGGIVG
jgi:fructose-1,6-bisphosphatase/inositol monophosphatase family enzyme